MLFLSKLVIGLFRYLFVRFLHCLLRYVCFVARRKSVFIFSCDTLHSFTAIISTELISRLCRRLTKKQQSANIGHNFCIFVFQSSMLWSVLSSYAHCCHYCTLLMLRVRIKCIFSNSREVFCALLLTCFQSVRLQTKLRSLIRFYHAIFYELL